jgi:plastocyanin
MPISAIVRIRTLLGVVVASAVLAGPVPGSATPQGDETRVLALDDFFLPSLADVPRGETVVWDFSQADRSHSATDSSGMGLFDSGLISPGGPSFAYTFTAAGTYPYTCTIHSAEMNGRVRAPIRVSPRAGELGRAFTVRWAGVPAPSGFVYDVERRRNDGSWTSWLSDATAGSAAFEPTRPGTYRFRARLRRQSAGASGWSPAASVTVN